MPMLAYFAYVIGAVTLAFWLSTVLTASLICRLFAFNLNKLMTNGHCGSTSAYFLSVGITNMLIGGSSSLYLHHYYGFSK